MTNNEDADRVRKEDLGNNKIYTITGEILKALEKILKVHIVSEGLENLTNRPTLFVVNHFTRIETIIVPYVLYKQTGQRTHSLATGDLFKGVVGRYIKEMGSVSVADPLRNRHIISDLLTGTHNWVIYPEGVMVKNKKVVENGHFHLTAPHRSGPPHTGAAVLALKTELIRRHYSDAVKKHDTSLIQYYEKNYSLAGITSLPSSGVVIIPVNITFYPIRPEDNTLSNLAARFFPGLSVRAEEELKVEGGFLVKDTDMTIYFGKPINVGEYVAQWGRYTDWFSRILEPRKRDNIVIWSRKSALTRLFMNEIYSKVAVNIDHICCMALRKRRLPRISTKDFQRAIYLSALTIRDLEDRRTHPSLRRDLVSILLEEPYEPLDNIIALAQREGAIWTKGGIHIIRHARLAQHYHFHAIRIRNVLQVIANEVEPIKSVVDVIDKYVNMPRWRLQRQISSRLQKIDQEEFEKDYDTYFEEGLSKAPSIGRPFFLKPKRAKAGIVLCHGYLAAPEEVRPLAQFLYEHGYGVYAVRMKGFGTAPRQLLDVTWENWLHSFRRAHAIVRSTYDKVYAGGFSTGGLLALLSAANKKAALQGLFCINTPIMLADMRSRFVGAGLAWSALMTKLGLPNHQLESIENQGESPTINYSVNYLKGIKELKTLIEHCRSRLADVTLPCLVIQSSHDPVVNPESAKVILSEIRSQVRDSYFPELRRHAILRDQGCEAVFYEVLSFLKKHEK